MNKDTRYHQDKRLLALEREEAELRRRQNQWVHIDPPIQRGWVRRWRLTAAARTRPDSEVLEIILAQVNTEQFHWRRSFEYGKHRRGKMITLTQGFWRLSDHDWRRLGWPEDWKKYFKRRFLHGGILRQANPLKFDRRDLVELHVTRHFVWELALLDPEAERRSNEIKKTIGYEGRKRLDRMWGNSDWWSYDTRRKNLDRLAARRIRAALAGDVEAEMSPRKMWVHVCLVIAAAI